MARPIFCGNFDFEARASDLERLFRRFGKVDRVDMKNGFAFIYMDDERDAGYAIRALDRTDFGRKGRRLRVEWTKHEQGGRKPVSSRKSANLRPSKTLFVINFPSHTQTRDLERHFDPYGKIVNVRIRGNFGFVQYDSQEDATKALDATNMSKFLDRVITVEYSSRGDDDSRRNGYSPDRRVRDRSPRRRSPSPFRRERGSPDYGTGPSPISYRRERGSPVYGNGSSRSPRRLQRASPGYNRKRSLTPRRDVRASPEYRGRGRSRSRSPRGENNGNGYGRQPSLVDSDREEGAILDDDPEPASPIRKHNSMDRPIGVSRSPVDNRYKSRSPLALDRPVGESRSPVDNSRSPNVRERSQS
ncbi:serine/arginine-rich splicing factor RS40-like isoform X1 [Silene latifolia]|uniref:serine/arginine-rich splicing factor RS40-like isoform X1 n=2 Tax=Silene latifolia TaxID=37657 RepID=UPI003D77762A